MAILCDYCGNEAKLVGGDQIYPHRPDLAAKRFWACKPCDAYVGCHPRANKKGKGGQGDGTVPLGRLANSTLRLWKMKTHDAFDPIWKRTGLRRKEAYGWLAEKMGIDKDACHIGMFTVEQCRQAIEICKQRGLPPIGG